MKRQLQLDEAWGKKGASSSKLSADAAPWVPAQPQTASAKKGYTTASGWLDLGGGCEIGYWPRLIPPERSAAVFEQLQKESPWAQRDVVVMGRSLPQPRLIAYYADEETGSYTYSKLTLEPTPFTPLLLELKQEVEKLVDKQFNSVLLNCYRNGKDCVGWHSDDEKLYGKNSTIVSLSFGHGRDFLMRKKPDKNQSGGEGDEEATYKFLLGAGDAFVMRGSTQSTWQHSVPRRQTQNGPRINCTFRTIVVPEKR